jgi:glycosyltransferase involved in cell wall biosynthesis
MPETLPHITFVIHDVEGGVASMNHQIVENAAFRSHFRVHILLWKSLEDKSRKMRNIFSNADEITEFPFSVYDNYYYTLKRLNELLNRRPGLVVTNDGLELESIRKFGTPSIVFSIVHDFYNLKLAIGNLDIIDYFICHTEVFTKALSSNPILRERVKYLPHGVKIMADRADRAESADRADRADGADRADRAERVDGQPERLKIVSISRLTASKGVLLLSEVDDLLLSKGIDVEWIIIGSGELEDELKKQWKDKNNIRFYQPDTSEQVMEIARTGDVFISPSSFEGYGIALLEAMSCGLVPVIYKLPVGIYADLPAAAGFSVGQEDKNGLADNIRRLHLDRALLERMSRNAYQLVAGNYNIADTSLSFLTHFSSHAVTKVNIRPEKKRSSAMGVLDRPFFPNKLVRMVKKLKN